MTESQWLACRDPELMLEYLRSTRTASARKFLLFGCACCRRVENLLQDDRNRLAIVVAERCADYIAGKKELNAARKAAWLGVKSARLNLEACAAARGLSRSLATSWPVGEAGAAWLAALATFRTAALLTVWKAALAAAQTAGDAVGWLEAGTRADASAWEPPATSAWNAARRSARTREETAQADLLRHIVGNPFHPADPIDAPSCVVDLARALYAGQDCAFALHDALLEAGHAELAEHFRTTERHPKGCWMLDRLLDKE